MKLYINISLSVEDEASDFYIESEDFYDDSVEVELVGSAHPDKSDDVPQGWWDVEIEQTLPCDDRMPVWEQHLIQHIEKEMREGGKFEEIARRLKQYLDARKPAHQYFLKTWL